MDKQALLEKARKFAEQHAASAKQSKLAPYHDILKEMQSLGMSAALIKQFLQDEENLKVSEATIRNYIAKHFKTKRKRKAGRKAKAKPAASVSASQTAKTSAKENASANEIKAGSELDALFSEKKKF
ncbi:hypothetical protein D6817_01980 [Candidatus Pacearchaeota archaeon]|nr:MAG: hypothetical protein D6817_01980 [Candidatus Pacearchaeota archaeon]